MRLNRVLQMTAAVSMAMAATVFTISCGEDGSDGKEGGDCTVTGASAPFAVICGGQQVGTLNDGSDGAPGATGNTGNAGANGKTCTVTPSTGGSWQISCDGENKGTLGSCSVAPSLTNAHDVVIGCGDTRVNLCDSYTYDPSTYYCQSTGGVAVLKAFCGPNKTPYFTEKEYCGFESKTASINGTPKVLAKCAATGAQPNEAEETTSTTPDGETVSSWGISDGWQDEYCSVTRNLADENGDVLTSTTLSDSTTAIQAGRFIDVRELKTPELCAGETGTPSKFNDGEWQGEYCGYATDKSNSKKKVSNACGNGEKPDEEIFGRVYCQMKSPLDKLSSLVKNDGMQFCAPMLITDETATIERAETVTGTPDGTYATGYKRIVELGSKNYTATGEANRLNEVKNSAKLILAPKDFKKHYCQFVKSEKTTAKNTSFAKPTGATALTDTIFFARSSAADATPECFPNDRSEYLDDFLAFKVRALTADTVAFAKARPRHKNQYCQYATDNTVSAAGGKTAYCIPGAIIKVAAAATSDSKYDSLYAIYVDSASGTTTRMNWDKKYGGEYCGYATSEDYKLDATSPTDTSKAIFARAVQKGKNCTTGFPNEVSKVDVLGYWPNQYCQLSSGGTSKVVGIDDIMDPASPGTAPTTDADVAFDKFLGIYCLGEKYSPSPYTPATDKKTVVAKYQAAAAKKINALGTGATATKWDAQACAITSTGFAATPNKTYSVVSKALCSDKTVANSPSKINGATDMTYWPNEYCQAKKDGSTTMVGLSIESDSRITTTNYQLLDVYCLDTNGTTALGILNPTGDKGIKTLTGAGTTSRLNELVWGGQFCQFKSYADFTKKTNSRGSGFCGNTENVTDAPNHYSRASAWNDEYCQFKSDGATQLVGYATGPNAYCMTEKQIETYATTPTTAISGYRLNATKWESAACVEGVKVICTGGQEPTGEGKGCAIPD